MTSEKRKIMIFNPPVLSCLCHKSADLASLCTGSCQKILPCLYFPPKLLSGKLTRPCTANLQKRNICTCISLNVAPFLCSTQYLLTGTPPPSIKVSSPHPHPSMISDVMCECPPVEETGYDEAELLQALSSTVSGLPGRDYPIYSAAPNTSFSCDGLENGGQSPNLDQ